MTGTMEYIDHKHILTQDERNEMGMQLAEKQIEIQTLLEEKKGVTSSYTAKVDIKKAEISLAATQIKDGYIILSVYAERRRNFRDKVWEWMDPNTGEVLKTKPFEGTDFQMRVGDVDESDEAIPGDESGEVQDVEHSEVLMIGPGIAEPEETDGDDPDTGPDGEETDEPKKGRKGPKKGGDK